MHTLLFKFKNRKIKMYQKKYKNRMVDDNEYSQVLQSRMQNLLNQYNSEVSNLTRIGVTNLGFGQWDNGENKINSHVNKVSETLEKMQSTQALIDALTIERAQSN
ncbi:TPA: hypothetical protein N5O03_000052 [Enterobacter hormaechei subsp. xiangfangensis]|nr:hypothetical protein [Enterobacter hormaechei]HAV1786426.1 hypothetical protein [Enterobacter hormaechei subsp. xiangfangensis]HCM9365959.1 hypothetical protein [Enterobacter hormaechei subsp. xiangfangensis]HCM9384017.1 hypothetical protein [Enterobacter hormaechei subsp. xiangfangensis]HCM9694094.1 hypothetical protein [Enterobacter hormaechei subsp. xiangfangensis]